MKTEKEIEAQRRYCAERGHDYAPWDYLPGNACSICARADDERDEDPPEPREPDDDEVSWQEYGRAEAYADAEMARYDDDPNPYAGTYSEM